MLRVKYCPGLRWKNTLYDRPVLKAGFLLWANDIYYCKLFDKPSWILSQLPGIPGQIGDYHPYTGQGYHPMTLVVVTLPNSCSLGTES